MRTNCLLLQLILLILTKKLLTDYIVEDYKLRADPLAIIAAL